MLDLSRVVIHAFDLEYPDQVVVPQRFFPHYEQTIPGNKNEIRNLI